MIEQGSKRGQKLEKKEKKMKETRKKWVVSESVEELIDLSKARQQELQKVESKEDR